MFSRFTWKGLRGVFQASEGSEELNQISDTAARQCVERVLKRLDRSSERLSAAQMRGYLRAIALPMIDRALEEISKQQPRVRGSLVLLRNLVLDGLENLVIENLEKRSAVASSRVAA